MNTPIHTHDRCEEDAGIIYHCPTNTGVLTQEDPNTGLPVAVLKLVSFTEGGAKMIDYIRDVALPRYEAEKLALAKRRN